MAPSSLRLHRARVPPLQVFFGGAALAAAALAAALLRLHSWHAGAWAPPEAYAPALALMLGSYLNELWLLASRPADFSPKLLRLMSLHHVGAVAGVWAWLLTAMPADATAAPALNTVRAGGGVF